MRLSNSRRNYDLFIISEGELRALNLRRMSMLLNGYLLGNICCAWQQVTRVLAELISILVLILTLMLLYQKERKTHVIFKSKFLKERQDRIILYVKHKHSVYGRIYIIIFRVIPPQLCNVKKIFLITHWTSMLDCAHHDMFYII